jgi:hypothetical protein
MIEYAPTSHEKLVYYAGNLSTFVDKHPEAKSYYTLAATSVKFAFPPPGSLMGVRSNTRAILKLASCTFTYPGRSTPSLFNVSCALSLSRYVFLVVFVFCYREVIEVAQPSRYYWTKRCWKVNPYKASDCRLPFYAALVVC